MSIRIYSIPLNVFRAITPEEWDAFTRRNIERAAKEIDASMKLRSYVENILNQIVKDLVHQKEMVNESFFWRIDETKQAKRNLEKQHGDVRQIFITIIFFGFT